MTGLRVTCGAWRHRAVYGLMTVSLGSAVLLKGGVVPSQWVWTALGIAVASCLSLSRPPKRGDTHRDIWGVGILALLLGWVLLQLVPLPPGVVAFISPYRFAAVHAASAATGRDPRSWMALSLAPAATLERLLCVVPAMAAFLTAGEMARWWADRLWVAVTPVIGIACVESLLGLFQFFGAHAASASGSYVNPDHFAGLLEIAFPLAVMGTVSAWRETITRHSQSTRTAIRASIVSLGAACLLLGILLSLSRVGVLATAAAGVLMTLALLGPRRPWRWLIVIAVPLIVLASLSPDQLVSRFAKLTATKGISQEGRIEIWRDSLQVVSAYPWTGCGLGAYQRGLYRFKHVAPVNTVDFAHNDYLQILAELGIPGALLFAALAGWILRRTLAVVLFARGRSDWGIAVGILGAMLALGIHGLTDFNLYIPANALALAWLAGVGSATRVPGSRPVQVMRLP